jgi:hypothetical protein
MPNQSTVELGTYPPPLAVTVVELIEPPEIVAVAAAPSPPRGTTLTAGADVNPYPAYTGVTLATWPLLFVLAVAHANPQGPTTYPPGFAQPPPKFNCREEFGV